MSTVLIPVPVILYHLVSVAYDPNIPPPQPPITRPPVDEQGLPGPAGFAVADPRRDPPIVIQIYKNEHAAYRAYLGLETEFPSAYPRLSFVILRRSDSINAESTQHAVSMGFVIDGPAVDQALGATALS